MISDTLSEAVDDISERQKYVDYGPQVNSWIDSVKAVMDGLLWYLDVSGPHIFVSEPLPKQMAQSLEQHIADIEKRIGLKVELVTQNTHHVRIKVLSPTGVPIVGGMLFWDKRKNKKGKRWLFGGLPTQFPEWWTAEQYEESACAGLNWVGRPGHVSKREVVSADDVPTP